MGLDINESLEFKQWHTTKKQLVEVPSYSEKKMFFD